MAYLDCFLFGAACGTKFPVSSFGPAMRHELEALADKIALHFDQVEIVEQTKGQRPLPKERWPKAAI